MVLYNFLVSKSTMMKTMVYNKKKEEGGGMLLHFFMVNFFASSSRSVESWTLRPAMPDGGIHRQITQNWRNLVTTWR